MTAHARDIGYLVNPPLHRHHDVDTLVVDLVDALRGEPVVGMAIDGTCATLVEVTVRVTFPDLALLEHVKPRLVDEVRRGMGKRVLGAWSIAAQAFLLDVTTTPGDVHQPPGVVSCEALHAASRALAPEIGMILGLGPAGASEMWPESYRAWTDHYRQLAMAILEGDP